MTGAPRSLGETLRESSTSSELLSRVSLVIPAKDEEASIADVIRMVPPEVREIIVVDGVSGDATAQQARDADPRVQVLTRTRKGKGNALACGFEAATSELIVAMDGDGSADPADIIKMIAPIALGDAKFVKGFRDRDSGYSGPTARRLGTSAITAFFNGRFDTDIQDACCGFIAFSSDIQDAFKLDAAREGSDGAKPEMLDGFEIDVALMARVFASQLEVAQQAVNFYPRSGGESKTRPIRDAQRMLAAIEGIRGQWL